LQSYIDAERSLEFAKQQEFQVVELTKNPIDDLWAAERPSATSSQILDYPIQFAGVATTEKCTRVRDWLATHGVDGHLLADPEDVAWLLNVRTDDCQRSTPAGWHIVPIPLTRALVGVKGDVLWFVQRSRLEPALAHRLEGIVQFVEPDLFESVLKERAKGSVMSADLRRTPHRFAAIAKIEGTLRDDPMVSHWRWKKHPSEIDGASAGHYQDGQAVIRFMAWVQKAVLQRTVTEMEAARKLKELRSESPTYKGMSMPLMSASGASGAMAHYVPSEDSNRRLNDHPIYWMDSGGQYHGCSTDNTVCIAVGEPEAGHIRAHTLVLKGFIALTLARFPTGTPSVQLDTLARQYLWQEGKDYGHGTGHGVGNFMNVHEGPLISKNIDHPWMVPMEAGMIVSNEPAYYVEGEFGIRIESHMVTVQSNHKGFLEFETLSRLPIDPRLIDASLLTDTEKRWLFGYHQRITEEYAGHFDEDTISWLQGIVDAYASMASGCI
jgi:Xaa-Pro aminopeptidase